MALELLCCRLARDDRPPVDDRVPQHPLIAAIHVAMHRVEVECHEAAVTDREIEERGAADDVVDPPGLPAHYERLIRRSSPDEHTVTRIDRPVEARRAICHPQPAAG